MAILVTRDAVPNGTVPVETRALDGKARTDRLVLWRCAVLKGETDGVLYLASFIEGTLVLGVILHWAILLSK